MSKINLTANLFSNDEKTILETVGIKRTHTIIYKENYITVTIKLFESKIEMNRECKDYSINLIFEKNKKTMSSYKLLGYNKEFQLETKTNKLEIGKNIINVEYILEGNKFMFYLEWR